MSDELKPCPFCGGSPSFESNVADSVVRCTSCSARVAVSLNPLIFVNPEGIKRREDRGAVADWNRRPPSPLPISVVAPIVRVKTMRLSDGRADHFVSIKVGDREVHPHVFREEFKAAYHVALYSWLLNGTAEPELMAFNEGEWPAQTTELVGADPAQIELLQEEVARLQDDLDEARQVLWPEWSTKILKLVRSYSGYDGYDDATEGVDLVAEVEEALSELHSEAEKLRKAAPAELSVGSEAEELAEINVALKTLNDTCLALQYDDRGRYGMETIEPLRNVAKLINKITFQAAETDRLRAIALDMQKVYITLKDLVERAQAIISTSTYPNWHEAARAALSASEVEG